MSVAERIGKLCEFEGSQKAVAEKAGISPAALSAILKRGSQARSDTLEQILKAYPNLNARWLITGKGDMWEGGPPESGKKMKTDHSEPNEDLLNRLLLQKLEEVAGELKENYPEAYKKLKLKELIQKKK